MPTTRPSPVTGGWLPTNPADRLKWLKDLIDKVESGIPPDREGFYPPQAPEDYSHKTVKDLATLIEDSVELSFLFRNMFEEVPFSYRFDPAGKPYNIVNYEQLLRVFDKLLDMPPEFNANVGIALPFSLVLEWPMATTAGIAAFLNKELNVKIAALLNEWGAYLADPRRNSKDVLVNDPGDPKSWLNREARAIMRLRDPEGRKFEDLYDCVPTDIYLGFKCWDDFFTRRFNPRTQPPVRPIEDANDDSKIASGCECVPLAIRQKVKGAEKFWIKGQPYSLKNMLDSVEDGKKFSGGTVYQAYLASLNYHHWHSPINGTITKLRLVPGTYFAISPTNSFPDPETLAGAQSQQYTASVATRALIYLNNATVGDMVMIPVGLVEVSTCEFNKAITDKMDYDSATRTWTPKAGQPITVKKGDELGTFHFGGSTHVMVFGPDIDIKFWQRAIPYDTEDNDFVLLGQTIADVKRKPPTKTIRA